MGVNSIIAQPVAPTGNSGSKVTEGLGSDDFFKLLIAQLANQDPLEPTSNEELLNQISSIRDIELSSTLTESLQMLTGQQRFASASSLIGQYVTGLPRPDGIVDSGTVVGVRFEGDGRPMLQLANGTEIAMERVATIESPLQAAEGLLGKTIIGLDRRVPSDPQSVEGLVTAVQVDGNGEVMLELDTGEDLRFRDLIGATSPSA